MQKVVLLFYKYQEVQAPGSVRDWQERLCEELGLKGRVRVAEEGINGTLCGCQGRLDEYVSACSRTFVDVDWKFSLSDIDAFDELRVRVVDSLVSRSSKVRYDADLCGKHLTAEEFHSKAQEKDVVLIDVRNSYEYAIGRFQGAVNPDTRNFSRFTNWLQAHKNDLLAEKTRFLMYCTGGIRCETASIELRKIAPTGVDIYVLSGGIHRYLEKYGTTGLFEGKNFVFDKRVTQQIVPLENKGNRQKTVEISVVGTCTQCSKPFDQTNDKRRCSKCRMLMLVCDACDCALRGKYYCGEHRHLNPHAVEENLQLLQAYESSLCAKLESPDLKGRKYKTKRQALKKQLLEIRALLCSSQGLRQQNALSPQDESERDTICDA